METLTLDNLFAGQFPAHGNSVTIVQGEGALARGAVLGKVTKGAISIAAGTNTGNGTAGTITRLAKAKVGAYTLICKTAATNAGTFHVIDPDGIRLADLTIAVAYNNGHFSITIADGATDFIVGDSFTVTVAAGSGKYRLVNSANTDGSDTAEAVLAESRTVAANADETNVPIYETGEFNSAALTFGGSDTYTTHQDALKKRNVFLRAIQAQ
jgi:hypothetical protein